MLGIDVALLLVIAAGPWHHARQTAGADPVSPSASAGISAGARCPGHGARIRGALPRTRALGDTSLTALPIVAPHGGLPVQDSAAAPIPDSLARPLDPAGPPFPVALGLAPEGVLPAAAPMSAAGPGIALPSVRLALPALALESEPTLADTTPHGSRRHLAVMLPDAYYTRLTIHRIGAYAIFPLFVTQYVLGQKLINGTSRPHSLKVAHGIVAGTIGIVFLSNTVTGVWNLWTARHVQQGRARRIVHSVIMLASDAGLTWAAVASSRARRDLAGARTHRNIAIGSMALSTAGALMMWIWKQ